MNFEDPTARSLDGTLLLADPSLGDPSFRRTVLYLNHHTDKTGAEGFILNRPLGKIVGDLPLGEDAKNLKDIPVYAGGPVATDHLIFASIHWREDAKKIEFTPRLSTTEAQARVSEGFLVIAFIGHAGWSAGQLEGELRKHAWITRRPDSHVVEAPPETLWRDLLETMSPWHYLLSLTPEDPSLN